MRRLSTSPVRKCPNMQISAVCRPLRTWIKTVRGDLLYLKITNALSEDHAVWRAKIHVPVLNEHCW